MFIQVGDLEIEALAQDDYKFYKQLSQEILGPYRFDTIPFEEGDAVIDIGAHVGIVSIYLAKTYGVRVYAYEPEPRNFECLCLNIGANQAEVLPRRLAVTADGREMEFRYGAHSGEGGAFHEQNKIERAKGQIVVPSTTVEDILRENELDEVKLLKLDCEGAEHEILRDSSGWLNRVGYVRAELHLNDTLREMGFSNAETMALLPKEKVAWQVAG